MEPVSIVPSRKRVFQDAVRCLYLSGLFWLALAGWLSFFPPSFRELSPLGHTAAVVGGLALAVGAGINGGLSVLGFAIAAFCGVRGRAKWPTW